jgi:zinc/manganese transport system ATP-binding protein
MDLLDLRWALDCCFISDPMTRQADTAVTLQELSVGHGRKAVLTSLSGHFQAGSLTAIVGPNGAGKSTLLKTIAGLLPPLAGQLIGHQRESGHLAYLPQHSEIDRSFPITVEDLVASGLWPKTGSFRAPDVADGVRITDAITTVGLSHHAKTQIGHLSGGQLQRALFARLMIQDADLILMDEPFTAIDNATVDALIALVLAWHQEGRTILAVLHDLDLVSRHFPETLWLNSGTGQFGTTAQFFNSRIIRTGSASL